MEKRPDILLFMSDQHSAAQMHWAGGIADTPQLDALSAEGTSFTQAYTSCPLCVPARMSFLSGLLPSNTGVLTNNDTLADTTPTFLHALVEAGYETVLIGRMHFVGRDQLHGFTKHIGGDMTPVTWNRPVDRIAEERGITRMGYGYFGALQVMGAGESPVLHFDEHIIATAKEYLAQPHERPQFILVGTYGPHFPYIAPHDLYFKYKERIAELGEAEQFNEMKEYVEKNLFLKSRQLGSTAEEALEARAAYCSLVEIADRQIGEIREAFRAYGENSGREQIFGYTSDHGDMNAVLGMYGKQTFFDPSVRIPLLLSGEGIPAGKKIGCPVSIMDIGPTLCELAGTSFETADSFSLASLDEEKIAERGTVHSQVWESLNPFKYPNDKRHSFGAMVVKDGYKYISYDGFDADILFDIKEDPHERENLVETKKDIAKELKELSLKEAKAEDIIAQQARRERNAAYFAAYERLSGELEKLDDQWRWRGNPPTARDLPKEK